MASVTSPNKDEKPRKQTRDMTQKELKMKSRIDVSTIKQTEEEQLNQLSK